MSTPAIEFTAVSRWYGDTVSLADVSFTADTGVVGLLGHNGAGKSTTLKLCAGFSSPSSGQVRIFGLDPRRNPDVYKRIGIVPDHSPPWPFLTAREVVELSARLHKVADYRRAAADAIALVALEDAAGRPVGEFSHGMRQRVKLAQALAHDPELLLLDEPLNGLDPTQRGHVIELLTKLGGEGRTVIVSSHVLHEVERMAPRVLVLVNGHLVAEGSTAGIRQLISERPRRVHVSADGNARALARELMASSQVDAVRVDDGSIEIETSDPAGLSRELPQAAVRAQALLRRVAPVGDDLESVYAYLHDRAREGAVILPIYRLTLRALLKQKRTIMLALVSAATVLTALIYALAKPSGSDDLGFYSGLVQQLFVPTVASLIALVFGVSAFGDEREDGTILYLVATPQPRIELVVAKILAAWTATLVLLAPSLVLTGLLSLGSQASLRLIGWPLLGVVLATLAYCSAAAWLSLRTRRPVVIGVIYIILWEGSIATFAVSAAKLSISAYGRTFVAHALPQAARPVTGMVASAIVLAVVVAVSAWGAARALVHAELP